MGGRSEERGKCDIFPGRVPASVLYDDESEDDEDEDDGETEEKAFIFRKKSLLSHVDGRCGGADDVLLLLMYFSLSIYASVLIHGREEACPAMITTIISNLITCINYNVCMYYCRVLSGAGRHEVFSSRFSPIIYNPQCQWSTMFHRRQMQWDQRRFHSNRRWVRMLVLLPE